MRENVGANGNTYTLESIGRPAPGGIDDPIVKGLMESTETKHHHHLMLLTKLSGGVQKLINIRNQVPRCQSSGFEIELMH